MPSPSHEPSSTSEPVRRFFEEFERSSSTFDLERIGPHYCEVFMFGSPQGVRAVRREDLLRVLPKRREFFESLGLKGTTYTSLEETRLDEHFILVEAHLTMRFEKDSAAPVENRDSSTFILHQQGDLLEIACQIEHDEIVHRMQTLGLLPAGS